MRNEYSILYKLKLAIYVLATKLLCRKARLIRFPIDLRGRKYIDFGESLTTGVGCRFEAFNLDGKNIKKIIFGRNIQVNDYVHISAMDCVCIGDNVLMASHIYISDNSHGCYKCGLNDSHPDIPPAERPYFVSPVEIGSNTWLGEGVIVMPGVKIGKGCVVGAHSVVTKSIPDYSMVAGTPAKVIKQFNFNNNKWTKVY